MLLAWRVSLEENVCDVVLLVVELTSLRDEHHQFPAEELRHVHHCPVLAAGHDVEFPRVIGGQVAVFAPVPDRVLVIDITLLRFTILLRYVGIFSGAIHSRFMSVFHSLVNSTSPQVQVQLQLPYISTGLSLH